MAGEIEAVEYFENPVLTKEGEERIIAVFCSEPFSVAPLREALTQGDALPVASSCSLDSLTIRKIAP